MNFSISGVIFFALKSLSMGCEEMRNMRNECEMERMSRGVRSSSVAFYQILDMNATLCVSVSMLAVPACQAPDLYFGLLWA